MPYVNKTHGGVYQYRSSVPGKNLQKARVFMRKTDAKNSRFRRNLEPTMVFFVELGDLDKLSLNIAASESVEEAQEFTDRFLRGVLNVQDD